MAMIGILGGNPTVTATLISQICQKERQDTLVHYHKITENNPIPIVSIDENTFGLPKVFILQEATKDVGSLFNNLENDGYLIVNADSRIDFLPAASVITYGFNGKASVTASSVADGAIQVCVQRGFKTLGGSDYGPQEFKVEYPADCSPLDVLGAACACAVCDVLL